MSPTSTNGFAIGRVARFTGGIYLAYILATVLADLLGHIGIGDAPQVYEAITTNEPSFRLGLVVALATGLLFVLTAWRLYAILRQVNGALALLFLLLNVVGVAVQGASMVWLLSALLRGDPASHMQAYSADQLEGLAYLSIGVYKTGFVTAQLFFSAWLFPLGYLVYKSGYLPRWLGVLLLPDYKEIIYPGLAVSFVAEFGLALWLLIKGVGPEARREPASEPA
jgi:nitrate reductase NapE component